VSLTAFCPNCNIARGKSQNTRRCGHASGPEAGFRPAVSGRIPYLAFACPAERRGNRVYAIEAGLDAAPDWDSFRPRSMFASSAISFCSNRTLSLCSYTADFLLDKCFSLHYTEIYFSHKFEVYLSL
jgi:hypothetical protein